MVCVLLAGIALIGTGRPAASSPAEGCVAVPGSSCSYVATERGGYVTSGYPWNIRVVRNQRATHYSSGSPFMQSDVIMPGDRVTAWAGTQTICMVLSGGGFVRVGASPGMSDR
jgi:hypothetical protein